MTHKKIWKQLSIAAAITGSFISADAMAASFQLRDNNASLLGVAHAGSAATVGDVATMANNPASMTYLNQHAVAFSLAAISPTFKFKPESASSIAGTNLVATSNSGGNGGNLAAIPAFYLMWNVNDRLKVGINATVPWGLKTEYNSNWVGRFFAIKSEIQTVNLNPSVAYKINDKISIGAGIQIQRLDAVLSNAILTPVAAEAIGEVSGGGWGFGGNAGILFEPYKGTRFGLAYRSHLKTDVTGNIKYVNRGALANLAAADGGKAETGVTLPEIVTLSFAQDVTSQWTVLTDIQYTRWSRLQELRIRFPEGAPNGAGVANKVQRFGYSDSWFASAGARYKANDKWTFKFGLAFDQSPTKDSYRDPRMPDANRMWYAGGLEYTTNDQLKFSLDYVFINVNEAPVDLYQPATNGTLRGKFDAHVHVLGAKVHYKF